MNTRYLVGSQSKLSKQKNMKFKVLVVTGLTILGLAFSSNASAQFWKKKKKKEEQKEIQAPLFTNFTDSLSFVMGAELAKNFKIENIQFNKKLVIKGFTDGTLEQDTLFSEAEKMEIKTAFQEIMMKEMGSTRVNKKAVENKAIGAAFLAEIAKQEGVITTPSGLLYKVIKEGEGENPKATSKVEVHYHGTFIDGTVFDSSVERGQTIEFPLNRVIKGWTEGLQLMKPGAKYIFYIPSNLAYGDRDRGEIPPGSTLIFEVELFGIK